MKRMLAIALLAGGVWAAEDAAPQPSPQETTPAWTEARAAAASVKRVMLMRCIRMCAERHRYTRENAAASAALAQELHAPAELVQLLQREAEESLSGRALHDQRRAMERLLRSYHVDELGLRLFVEAMHCTPEEQAKVAEALPMEVVFNLLPKQKATEAELLRQCDLLADNWNRMVQAYTEVQNREQAQEAAQKLLALLAAHDETMPLRATLRGARPNELPSPYALRLGPLMVALTAQRRRLYEVNYYGSPLLAAVDYLLN